MPIYEFAPDRIQPLSKTTFGAMQLHACERGHGEDVADLNVGIHGQSPFGDWMRTTAMRAVVPVIWRLRSPSAAAISASVAFRRDPTGKVEMPSLPSSFKIASEPCPGHLLA